MSPKNSDSIQRLRERFLAESEANPELYHPIDIERVKTEDWQLNRFIIDSDTEEEAYKELTRVLKWKKSFGLHERTDEYFPKEFFLIFGHEKYSRDKKDRIVTWNTDNRYRKIGEISPLIQQFLCHQLEKLDRAAGAGGWLSINDASGAGLFSVDMNMNNFRTDQLNQYPQSMQLSLTLDLPWILNSAFKVVKNFMNKKLRDKLVVIKREQLSEYVDIESIPECFGGKRKCSTEAINHLKPLKECKHLGLNEKTIEIFYKTYTNDILKTLS